METHSDVTDWTNDIMSLFITKIVLMRANDRNISVLADTNNSSGMMIYYYNHYSEVNG